MVEKKVLDVAKAKARELKKNPESYIIELNEKGSIVKALFLPKDKQIRGGSFELHLKKPNLSVVDIIYYQ